MRCSEKRLAEPLLLPGQGPGVEMRSQKSDDGLMPIGSRKFYRRSVVLAHEIVLVAGIGIGETHRHGEVADRADLCLELDTLRDHARLDIVLSTATLLHTIDDRVARIAPLSVSA